MLSSFNQIDKPSDLAIFQAVLADQTVKINQANALVRLFSIAGICTGITISLMIFWGARRTVFSRLSRLTADIEQISRTNLQTGDRTDILQSGQDEIGRISQALGQMVEFDLPRIFTLRSPNAGAHSQPSASFSPA